MKVDVQTFKLDFEIKASNGAYGPVENKTLRKLLKNIEVLAKKEIDFRFLLKTTTRASDDDLMVYITSFVKNLTLLDW